MSSMRLLVVLLSAPEISLDLPLVKQDRPPAAAVLLLLVVAAGAVAVDDDLFCHVVAVAKRIIIRLAAKGKAQDFPDSLKRLAFIFLCYNDATVFVRDRGKMGKRIVIIDDDHVIQESLQELFTDAGYTVSVASDGVSGFDLIVREKPDIVVADILLPQDARDRPVRKDQGQRGIQADPHHPDDRRLQGRQPAHVRAQGAGRRLHRKTVPRKELLGKIEHLLGGEHEDRSESQPAARVAPAMEREQKSQGGKSVDQDLDDLISWAHNKGKK